MSGGSEKRLGNLSMAEMLRRGQAIDISTIGEPVHGFRGSVWVMRDFIDGKDYCDAEQELWIFSIGRHKTSGLYYAAIDNRFYNNPMFECVWLR